MSARLSEGWSVAGAEAVILENAALRVTIVPEFGAKVFELIDKVGDRDVLWHNPRTPLRRAPYGANFDDWWSGGWDEIFPTGDRAQLHGELLPYMGELWSVPWAARAWIDADEAVVETSAFATMAPARVTRRLSIRGDEPVVRARYRIENLDIRPLPFLWGIHPAFAVTPAHRIDHPGSTMLVGVSSDPSMGVQGATYPWPDLPDPEAEGGRRDARLVRARDAGVYGGHWATDLADGWLALTDTRSGRGVALTFPPEVFPCAWLWQVYGGWRGHHHVCLEPWTGYPMQLEDAVQAGRASVLAPGEALDAEVAFVLFGDLDGVSAVDRVADEFRVR
jgi:hypothetical protein